MQVRHTHSRHTALSSLVLIATLVTLGGVASAGAPDLGAHPRMFLKGNTLAQLKANAAIPGSATARTIAVCDNVIAQPSQWASGGYEGLGFVEPFSACALAWVVRGDQASGTAAVKFFTALLNDYSAVGAGDGGDTVVQHDSGYSMRIFAPYAAIGYDWLQGAPGMTPALLATARERFATWTAWYATSGYNPTIAGSNYNAGYVIGATLIAVAEAGEAGATGDALWAHVTTDIFGTEFGPALAPGGVMDGGDWLEGWQYGPLSVLELSMAAKALRDSGVDMSAWSAWESATVARTLYASVPDQSAGYIGGDSESTTPHMPVQSMSLDGALLDDASPDMKAYAIQTIASRGLQEGQFLLGDALGEANAPAAQPFPMDSSTWLYAPGSRTLYGRTDWSSSGVWMASQCSAHRVPDHMWVNAGNLVMTRGSDHLIVDPTPYGGMSTLTGNAPTVPSPQLPSDYQPSQAVWGPDAVDFTWARQTQSGVIAARCDYAGQYQFQDTSTDVPRAMRDLVLVPYGQGDAAMIVVDDTQGATAGGLDVRFHAMGGFAPAGNQARAHVGASDLVAQMVTSSTGTPAMITPGVGDCFSSPRGECTIGRFTTGEWHLAVPAQAASAVTVLDAVGTGESPAAATAASGTGWTSTELDRSGGHIAVVAVAPGPTTVTYTAKPGLHVVVGAPAGNANRASVTATVASGGCRVTVSALDGSGGLDAQPVVATLGADCSVTEDQALPQGGGGSGTGSDTGSGTGAGSGSDGTGSGQLGGCSTSSPGSIALLGLVGFGFRRRQTTRAAR